MAVSLAVWTQCTNVTDTQPDTGTTGRAALCSLLRLRSRVKKPLTVVSALGGPARRSSPGPDPPNQPLERSCKWDDGEERKQKWGRFASLNLGVMDPHSPQTVEM